MVIDLEIKPIDKTTDKERAPSAPEAEERKKPNRLKRVYLSIVA